MTSTQLLQLGRGLLAYLRRKPLAVALAALAAACIGGAGYWNWRSGEALEPILDGREFRRAELEPLLTAFAQSNLDDWVCRDRRVMVPRRRRAEYLKAIDKAGALPGRLAGPTDVPSPHLLDTRQAREMKQQQANELAFVRMIEAMRGIEEATVKLSSRTRSGLHREVEHRALVAVRASDERPLTSDQSNWIRQLIVGGEAGLVDEDVTITDLNRAVEVVGVAPSIQGDGDAGTPADRVAASDTPWQDQLRRRVTAQLTSLEGLQVAIRSEVRKPAWGTPAARPAVAVRSEPPTKVQLSLPPAVLRQHFSAAGEGPTEPAELARRAEVRLAPVIEQIARCPVQVTVAPRAAPDTLADGTALANNTALAPQAASSGIGWSGLSDPSSKLWILGFAGTALIGVLLRPRSRTEPRGGRATDGRATDGRATDGRATAAFSRSVEQDPAHLAAVLERWSEADSEPDTPSAPAS